MIRTDEGREFLNLRFDLVLMAANLELDALLFGIRNEADDGYNTCCWNRPRPFTRRRISTAAREVVEQNGEAL